MALLKIIVWAIIFLTKLRFSARNIDCHSLKMCTKPRARYQNPEPPNQRNRSRLAKPARHLVMQMRI